MRSPLLTLPAASIDPLETAVALGAVRALAKRAAKLREEAAHGISPVEDRSGRMVPVISPEARTKAGIAADLDEIAADLTAPP